MKTGFVVAALALTLAGCASQQIVQPMDSQPISAKACPNGWTLKADAFSRGSLPSDLLNKVDRAIGAAKVRKSRGGTNLESYFTDSVSRTLGPELHELVELADVDADIVIRYIDKDPDGHLIIRRIGVLQMRHGTGTFQFPDAPTQYVAVGTGWPEFFISPTKSGSPKEPRLRILRWEWRQCNLRMSGIVP